MKRKLTAILLASMLTGVLLAGCARRRTMPVRLYLKRAAGL